jgi:hypothetical protein
VAAELVFYDNLRELIMPSAARMRRHEFASVDGEPARFAKHALHNGDRRLQDGALPGWQLRHAAVFLFKTRSGEMLSLCQKPSRFLQTWNMREPAPTAKSASTTVATMRVINTSLFLLIKALYILVCQLFGYSSIDHYPRVSLPLRHPTATSFRDIVRYQENLNIVAFSSKSISAILGL